MPSSRIAGAEDTGIRPSDLQLQVVDRLRRDVASRREDPTVDAMVRDLARIVQLPAWAPELRRAREALGRLDRASQISSAPPVESRIALGRLIKSFLGRLTRWYVGYVVQQVASFTRAVTEFGRLVLDSVNEVSARVDALERASHRSGDAHETDTGNGPVA